MIEITCKDLRKAAFAVGFGLTVGKYVGKMVNSVLDGTVQAVIAMQAEHGSEIAQKVCTKCNIEYKVKQKGDEEPKMRIGFI